MAELTIDSIPSRNDINGQFKPANIHRTLGELNSILRNGTYKFGELTAKYNGYVPGSPDYDNWMHDAGLYPEYVKATITNIIIEAMTNKGPGGPIPIQVSFTWTPSADEKAVKVSYDASVPSFMIEIIGYQEPPSSALAERRAKKKKY